MRESGNEIIKALQKSNVIYREAMTVFLRSIRFAKNEQTVPIEEKD